MMKNEVAGLSQDELDALKEKYESLYSREPSSGAFVFLAEILRLQGKIDRAAEILIKGLKEHPGSVTARCILGRIYYDRWMIDEARRMIEEVLKSAPDNLPAARVLLVIYRSEGKLEKAVEVAHSARLFNPEDDEIMAEIEKLKREIAFTNRRGFSPVWSDKDEIEEPMNDGELEPLSDSLENEIYTEVMADLYVSQKLYENAVRVFEKLAEDDPENRSIRVKLDQARTHLANEIAGFGVKR